MKIQSMCLVVVALVTFSACKNEKKVEVPKEVITQVLEPNFIVEIEAKVSAKDDFAVYYTEDKSNEFDGTMAVWTGIDGGDKFQKVALHLPQEVVPTNIRIDFGINKDQKDISVKNVTMLYQGMSFVIQGDKFFDYFIDTKEFPATVDPVNGTLEIKYEAGKFKTPYFYPTEKLLMEVQAICYPQ